MATQTDAIIAAARSYINARLSGTCVTYAYSEPSDGMGGGTITQTVRGTVACSIAPRWNDKERVAADGLDAVADWTITLPYGSTIDERDVIKSAGFTYEVVWADTMRSDSPAVIVHAKLLTAARTIA